MDPYGRGFYPPGPPAGYPPYPGAPGMPPGFPPGQPFPPPGAPPMHPPPGFQPPPGMPPYMRPPPQGIPPFPPGAPMIPPPHLPPNMQPHPLARGPMPPLPPGPMGGIPPVMPTNPPPLPVLPGRGAPIPLHANTMQPQPPSDRSISTPSPLAFPFLLDKKTTVYVGKISPKADNELMQQLLEVCGRVDSWRRLKDPATNQWSTFGFCDFHSAEGALRALKLLNGFQVEGEPLLVKVDEKTSKFLEEYKTKKEELAKKNTGTPAKEEPKSEAEAPAQAESESKPTDEGAAKAPTPAEKKDDQELEEARTALKQVIETHEERKRQAAQMKEEAMKATMDRLLASAQATPTDLELPEDKKKAEQIIESIRKFREMEAQRERERREREKDRERDQSRLRRRERERERERQKEEERERRRREREAERAGRRDRDSHRSPDDSERSRRPHRDDRSQTPQREPAPSPSSAPETPNEQQQQSETTAAAVAASPSQQQQQQQQTPKPFTVAPTKLKLATSTPAGPRVQQPLFSDEETTDAPWTVKQKRPLVRLDNDSETKKARMDEKNARAADEAEMQKQQQQQQQQKPIDPKTIIQNIPTEKEELFAFPINWEAVDKHKLHEKLRGWIEKKIKEYLGEEEADMVDFIVSKLSLHSPASEVLEDLSPVLDVDAETFVKSLWRMLIFETMTATE